MHVLVAVYVGLEQRTLVACAGHVLFMRSTRPPEFPARPSQLASGLSFCFLLLDHRIAQCAMNHRLRSLVLVSVVSPCTPRNPHPTRYIRGSVRENLAPRWETWWAACWTWTAPRGPRP